MCLVSIKRGYTLRVADTSKYDFNTGQVSLFCLIPQEIISTILLQNNIEDLIAFSMACRQFKKYSEHFALWRGMYKKIYGRQSRTKNCTKEVILKRLQEANMIKGNQVK